MLSMDKEDRFPDVDEVWERDGKTVVTRDLGARRKVIRER